MTFKDFDICYRNGIISDVVLHHFDVNFQIQTFSCHTFAMTEDDPSRLASTHTAPAVELLLLSWLLITAYFSYVHVMYQMLRQLSPVCRHPRFKNRYLENVGQCHAVQYQVNVMLYNIRSMSCCTILGQCHAVLYSQWRHSMANTYLMAIIMFVVFKRLLVKIAT